MWFCPWLTIFVGRGNTSWFYSAFPTIKNPYPTDSIACSPRRLEFDPCLSWEARTTVFPNQHIWEEMLIQIFCNRTRYKKPTGHCPGAPGSLSRARGPGWVPGLSDPTFTVSFWNSGTPTMEDSLALLLVRDQILSGAPGPLKTPGWASTLLHTGASQAGVQGATHLTFPTWFWANQKVDQSHSLKLPVLPHGSENKAWKQWSSWTRLNGPSDISGEFLLVFKFFPTNWRGKMAQKAREKASATYASWIVPRLINPILLPLDMIEKGRNNKPLAGGIAFPWETFIWKRSRIKERKESSGAIL